MTTDPIITAEDRAAAAEIVRDECDELPLHSVLNSAAIRREYTDYIAAIIAKHRSEREKRLVEMMRECLKCVDDCYEVTGHVRVAKTSQQRLKIEQALKDAPESAPSSS